MELTQSDLKEIAKIISEYAPLLGSVIHKENPLCDFALKTLCHSFDVRFPSDLLKKIPDFDSYSFILKNLETMNYDLLLANQTDILKDNKKSPLNHIMINVLGVIVILGFFCLCVLNFFYTIDGDDHLLTMLVGQMSAGFLLVLSHFFSRRH